MLPFVDEKSVVRKIWGRRETVLFIFAGASAEFALNKAVDWLYFTGKLPNDPIGRLFSTVTYARRIVFSKHDDALKVIDAMKNIHHEVEQKRNASIPDWAYRDVLYMLVHYSIASFELFYRRMSLKEKIEVYDVFYRVGARMGLKALPPDYNEWLISRNEHMNQNLIRSKYTDDLFLQYKKHLGDFRFYILKQAQSLVIPGQVREHLGFQESLLMMMVIPIFKVARFFKVDWYVVSWLLPAKYKQQIKQLNYPNQNFD